jgi:alpha-galactosidase/6-phospho-beta-glucosidase family protein
MAVKIGVIGAGSAVFSLELVRDLCLAEGLYGSTVTFMDVDEERLTMVVRLAERFVDELGVDVRFEGTLDRARALSESSFVLNTALVGGHHIEEGVRWLGHQHGYGTGSLLQTSFKQYAMMLAVARDVERICPNAWIIQSSNPVHEGCTLMTRQTGVKVIGLCHGFLGYLKLARAIGVPEDELDQVQWDAPGVNHWIYLTQFRHNGKDLYPLIDRWIEERAPQYWATFKGPAGDIQLSRGVMDHYRRIGLMPIGDTCRLTSEWHYHTDWETKRRWFGHLGGSRSEPAWSEHLVKLDQRIRQMGEVAADRSRRVTDVFPPERGRELQVPIIDAIANDRPGVFQVNVPNRGTIASVPDDMVVEGKALVDGSGARLLNVGRLPDKLMHLVLGPRIAAAEREIAAFQSGDYELLLGCLLVDDDRTRSLEQAESYLDAMLALPWNADLRQRFAKPSWPSLAEYTLEAAPEPTMREPSRSASSAATHLGA